MADQYRRGKRARSSSPSDLDSDSDMDLGSPFSSPRASPPVKQARAPSPTREFLCTLPPSCSQPSTAQKFASAAELDAHQAAFHRWVCRVPVRDKPGRVGEGADVPVAGMLPEHFAGRNPGGRGKSTKWRECGKVFPDGRLLDLHEAETHDPNARDKIDAGEKIFACFLPPEQCSQVFYTPKKRRWHMINDHCYPKEYFFAITNHGLNQLTRTDGLAASLIRPRRDFPAEGSSPPEKEKPAAVPTRPADNDGDVDMEALAARLASLDSSLDFVPRTVARRTRQQRTSRMEL